MQVYAAADNAIGLDVDKDSFDKFRQDTLGYAMLPLTLLIHGKPHGKPLIEERYQEDVVHMQHALRSGWLAPDSLGRSSLQVKPRSCCNSCK